MIRKVDTIKFESKEDVIDYVCNGLPPRKNDYEKLIHRINSQEDEEPEVYFTKHVQIKDSDEFTEILGRVYKDNCRNRNIGVGALVIGIVVGTVAGLTKLAGSRNDDDKNE